MEHFIIIRYSVLFNNRPEFTAKSSKLFDEDRLDFRLNLFENFCFPSIKNQTLKDFKVIILYDEKLPKKYYDRIVDITKDEKYVFLHKWNIEDNLSSSSWLKPYIKDYNEEKYIITTRLDDDDMINSDINNRMKKYMKRFNCIQKIVSFTGGNFLNIYSSDKMELFRVKYKGLSIYLTKIHKMTDPNIYAHVHHNHGLPQRIINIENAFIQLNHIYENDNRLQRFSKKKGRLVNKKELFEIL